MVSPHSSNMEEIEDLPIPVMAPRVPDRSTDCAGLTMTLAGGTSLSVWSDTTPLDRSPQHQVALQLSPEQWLVIGRQEGGEIPYLDPRYQSTHLLPNGDHSIVDSIPSRINSSVSRGHFMLKGSAIGIVLVNGVPRRGGGIRPPINGTLLLEPENRPLSDGEELLIERGQCVRIQLPNQAVILLQAA